MRATGLGLSFLLLLGVLAPSVAAGARSHWSPATQSQLRLLLGGAENGRLLGGIEILLEPGWYTYWRNPGEAGVPPVFDFSRSENIAAVEVLYPTPERYDDGSSISLIYRDEIVFPLVITPVDAATAVHLTVEARYGVCREVCIPTEAAVSLSQPAWPDADPLAEARLQKFASKVPKPPQPGRFDVENVVISGEDLVIDVRMPDSSYSDLFAVPPAGWFTGQPTLVAREDGVSRYRLDLVGRPKDETITGQRFRFVSVAGGEAIEEEIEIR